MTLGEKIRQARKSSGLSQEQLADKLCVSRSAIAKWETDKGLPDVENLKLLSRLLRVSVDTLLDDKADTVIREPVNPEAYGRGCGKVKKDRMMLQRFPDAKICTLLGRPELKEEEPLVDSTLGFLTPSPFGSPEFLKSIRQMDKSFYLIEQEGEQLFVTVTDEYLEIRPVSMPANEKSFLLGGWRFIRCAYLA